MKSASLLVYTPGIPLAPESMVPQRELGTAAAVLLIAGHETRVVDCGSIDLLQRIATPALRAQARVLLERVGAPLVWEAQPNSRAWQEAGRLYPLLAQARYQRDRHLLAEVLAQRHLDFVAFFARTGDDAAETLGAAATLRAERPSLKLLLFGPYAEEFGVLFLEATRHLDAAVVGEYERALPAWAEVCGDPLTWERVPGLLYRHGGGLRRTWLEITPDLSELPEAVYGAPIYPGLVADKVKLYSIEQSRGLPRPGYGVPTSGLFATPVRGKRPSALHEEILAVHKSTGARAFHLSGRGASVAAQDALAVLLCAHPLDILYSRTGAVARLEITRLSLLAASGCCALDFQIDTGSQRLLEDFYGNDFSVTPMEKVLRACRAAGIYTAVHLTYPCPYDDRHTRAETLRIIDRCRPDAAVLRPPRLLPGAPWCARAQEFGFAVGHQHYLHWARTMLAESLPSVLPGGRWPSTFPLELPYRMHGWPQDRAIKARCELLEQVRALNISITGSAQMGLMARLAGYAGEEGAFIERFTRALLTFDVETVASLAACVNANAVRPKNSYVLRPYRSVLAAVAN